MNYQSKKPNQVEMKKNYNDLMFDIINNLDYVPRLLIHSCCAPCSSHVLTLLSEYFKITVLYYNPNIEPIEEYEKRKLEQIRFINEYKAKNKIDLMDIDYDNLTFRKYIKGLEAEKEGGARCNKCFYLRLDKTAKLAKDNNYDYFGTTLTVSPYKNHIMINNIGEKLAKKYDIKYLYSDFKKQNGYKNSIELSKKYNLYRQHYCGCLFSKIEAEEVKE